MKKSALLALASLLLLVPPARGGHEMPVYPSYYPQEIRIERVDPARAAEMLRQAKIHAYLGPGPLFPSALPPSVGAVESLGSFVLVRVNPASPLLKAGTSACAVAATILRELAAARGSGFVFHPYPVTPYHGDYLDQADLADAAKARFLAQGGAPASSGLRPKVITESVLGARLLRSAQPKSRAGWDASVEEADAAALLSSSTQLLNGWVGPRWRKEGWYQAYRLLEGDLGEPLARSRAAADLRRLEGYDYDNAVERINLERDLVRTLTSGCGRVVAGYTVKRQFFNDEFSSGIENIAFDSIAGFNSPMFLRTVKLKDFPWNGWLRLGVAQWARAAWNPIGGFTDDTGQLLWFAVGDPAMMPAPYDAGWVVNRVSDVQSFPAADAGAP